MAWRLQRHLPAWHPSTGHDGPHMMGEVAVYFDETGMAVVDDVNVVELARQFPDVFQVDEIQPKASERAAPESVEHDDAQEQTARGAIPTTPHGLRAASLEEETVVDLRELATSLDIPNVHRFNKTDLIAAILAKQDEDAST